MNDKAKRGALFVLRNTKYWAGPATGQPCDVCSQPISRGNECEILDRRGYVYTHVICHSLWYRASVNWLKEQVGGNAEEGHQPGGPALE